MKVIKKHATGNNCCIERKIDCTIMNITIVWDALV